MVNFPTVTCNLAFQCLPFRLPFGKEKKKDTQTNANISAESFSLSLSLLSSVNCSLCCTGCRADVNTTPNYKSNSKRAMLCCPAAPSTKAQPSYPNIPHWTAGNMWSSYSRLTIETENSSEAASVKGMLGMFCSSFSVWSLLVSERDIGWFFFFQ